MAMMATTIMSSINVNPLCLIGFLKRLIMRSASFLSLRPKSLRLVSKRSKYLIGRIWLKS